MAPVISDEDIQATELKLFHSLKKWSGCVTVGQMAEEFVC